MPDTQPKVSKPKKPKYKYTRELVRIAIQDGMTQKEIGDLCRVEQSIVSKWQNGKTLAFEHQVAELKKRYGGRLNRTTSRVYLVRGELADNGKWEDSPRAQRLLRLYKEEKAAERRQRAAAATVVTGAAEPKKPSPHDLEVEEIRKEIFRGRFNHHYSVEALIAIDREGFEWSRRAEVVTLVEGPIVLRYTFVRHRTIARGNVKDLVRVPIARWLVHHQKHGRFVLAIQERRPLVGAMLQRWQEIRSSAHLPETSIGFTHDESWVDCADDAGRWISYLEGPIDTGGLLSWCDEYFADATTLHSPHDELAVPFLLRKMLVELGYDVPGVVRIGAEE